MKIKYFVLILMLIIISASIVSACPPSQDERLYIKQITLSSDKITFFNSNFNIKEYEKFDSPTSLYFNFSEDFEKLIILVNENEIINLELASLRTEIKWKNTFGYKFPEQEIFEYLYKPYNNNFNLTSYNNSIFKIYLDDELVQEYVLEYIPALDSKCGNYYNHFYTSPFFVLPVFFVIIIAIIITIVVVIKKRKKF